MAPLRSADLFAGMAGWTLALSRAAEPALYCDNDRRSRTFLEAEMLAGRLPSAPIVDDVRDTRALAALGPVDIVTAGFPCSGFSSAGARRGLLDNRSALFHDTVIAAVALRADHVALENVEPGARDLAEIVRVLAESGFTDVGCTVVSAADVGAPHARRRWFCLASRPGRRLLLDGLRGLPEWRRPPAMTVRGLGDADHDLLALLGNSLVPQAARTALLRLTRTAERLTPPAERAPGLSIVLDPLHYDRDPQAPSPRTRSSELARPVTRRAWPTPRHGPCSHAHVLTERASWDLGTAVRFAASVDGSATPRTSPRDKLNPAFVTWLMRGDSETSAETA